MTTEVQKLLQPSNKDLYIAGGVATVIAVVVIVAIGASTIAAIASPLANLFGAPV